MRLIFVAGALISLGSNHPLKETLISQTGAQEADRRAFLRDFYSRAWASLLHRWEPEEKEEPKF